MVLREADPLRFLDLLAVFGQLEKLITIHMWLQAHKGNRACRPVSVLERKTETDRSNGFGTNGIERSAFDSSRFVRTYKQPEMAV